VKITEKLKIRLLEWGGLATGSVRLSGTGVPFQKKNKFV